MRTISSRPLAGIIAVATLIVASQRSLASKLFLEVLSWLLGESFSSPEAAGKAFDAMTVRAYRAAGVEKGDAEYSTLSNYFSFIRGLLLSPVNANTSAIIGNLAIQLIAGIPTDELAAQVTLRKLYDGRGVKGKGAGAGAATGGTATKATALDTAKAAYKALSKKERSAFMAWAVTVKK